MNPKNVIFWLVFLAKVPNTLASSCDLIVRVADLQDIINNQRKVAESQTQVIEDQKQMIKNQATQLEVRTGTYL